MLNSRDISLLRPDVAENCRIFLQLLKLAGYDALVTGTVRDGAYQRWCYDNHFANTPTPSFHGEKAGLAFDICKNKKGEEYIDKEFWRAAAAIGKKIGFTWGGDWKSISDKPHFQHDVRGAFTGAMIRSGHYPPAMLIYEGDAQMTIDEIKKDLTAVAGTGNHPSEWAKPAINKFIDAQLFNGDGKGNYGCQQLMTREGVVQLLYNFAARLGLLDKLI